jgi:hypothetical protein
MSNMSRDCLRFFKYFPLGRGAGRHPVASMARFSEGLTWALSGRELS